MVEGEDTSPKLKRARRSNTMTTSATNSPNKPPASVKGPKRRGPATKTTTTTENDADEEEEQSDEEHFEEEEEDDDEEMCTSKKCLQPTGGRRGMALFLGGVGLISCLCRCRNRSGLGAVRRRLQQMVPHGVRGPVEGGIETGRGLCLQDLRAEGGGCGHGEIVCGKQQQQQQWWKWKLWCCISCGHQNNELSTGNGTSEACDHEEFVGESGSST